MAKNMTLKGLAVAASSALAIAGLSAAPAHALSVTLVTADGASYNTIAGETFTLTGRWSNDFANWNNALLEVVNSDELNFTVDTDDANGNIDSTAVASTDASATVDLSATDGSNLTIDVYGDDETEVGSVTVLFGIDADGSGSLETGEIRASRTVTFVDPADVTFTGGLTAPAIGEGTIDMTLSLSGNINVTTIALANLNLTLEDGAGNGVLDDTDTSGGTTDEVANAAAASPATFAVNDDEDGFDITLALDANASAGDKYVLQWTYTDASSGTETSALKSATVGTTDVTVFGADDVVATANVRDNSGDYDVRGGYTGNVTVTFTATDGTDPVAGETFNVVVSESALTDDTITSGGSTLEDGGDDIEYTAVSDADGVVSVTVKSDNGTDGEGVTVTVTNATNSSKTAAVDVIWADAAIGSVVNRDKTNVTDVVVAADETTHTVTLWLYDNFGALATDANYRWEIDNNDTVTYKNVSGGKATASYTLAGNNVVFTLEVQDASTSNWDADASTLDYTLEWIDADAQYAADDADPTLAAATVDVTSEEFASADTRDGDSAPDYAAGAGVALGGDLVDLAGGAVVGAVTVSAPGLAFSWNDQVYTTGSITVMTDNAGAWDVEVYGNVAGDYVLTVSAGSYSEDFDLEVLAVGDDAGTTVTIDAPATILPGGSATITAVVTDDFGNLVDTDDETTTVGVIVDWDGPGLTIPVDLAELTDTNADGEVSFRALLGSNDSGSAVVSVTYYTDIDDEDTYVTTQATIQIGTPAVATWTKNLGSGEVKMYAKNIVGAGKVQFMLNGEEIAWVRATSAADSKLRTANGASYLVRTVDLVEGQKNVLEVYVDGVRTTRTAYSY